MKTLLYLFITVPVLILQIEPKPTYCDGFRIGYPSGYCWQHPNCLPRLTPTCPLPALGFETFQDGYNAGFLQGKQDRQNDDSTYLNHIKKQ